MPELVEHGAHPVLVRTVVAEHAYVAFPVDIRAEGVLVLARPLVEVAAGEHGVYRDADRGEEDGGDRLQARRFEDAIQVELARRRLLEEGIRVVPGEELTRRDAEP